MAADPIRLILADDHPIVRQGLRQMIEADDDLTVVAETGDGRAALEAIRRHAPDVAVLDIDMPVMDGFAVARALLADAPGGRMRPEVVFLTMHSEAELFEAALDLGIKGYVLKESAVTDIVASIKAVAAGQPYLSPALSAHLLNRRQRAEDFDRGNPGLAALTTMERRVLSLIATDLSSKEIAARLSVSPRTVESHRLNIGGKLGLRGSLALVRFALQNKAQL